MFPVWVHGHTFIILVARTVFADFYRCSFYNKSHIKYCPFIFITYEIFWQSVKANYLEV